MNHELANKLKEAGFSQQVHRNNFCGNDACGPENRICAYDPTLEELIEACGNEFWELRSSRMAGKHSNWVVISYTDEKVFKGNTLEEVVANLWLELQK